jgi:hypothetical protein
MCHKILDKLLVLNGVPIDIHIAPSDPMLKGLNQCAQPAATEIQINQ